MCPKNNEEIIINCANTFYSYILNWFLFENDRAKKKIYTVLKKIFIKFLESHIQISLSYQSTNRVISIINKFSTMQYLGKAFQLQPFSCLVATKVSFGYAKEIKTDEKLVQDYLYDLYI